MQQPDDSLLQNMPLRVVDFILKPSRKKKRSRKWKCSSVEIQTRELHFHKSNGCFAQWSTFTQHTNSSIHPSLLPTIFLTFFFIFLIFFRSEMRADRKRRRHYSREINAFGKLATRVPRTSLLSFLTSSSASSARATNWGTEMETRTKKNAVFKRRIQSFTH